MTRFADYQFDDEVQQINKKAKDRAKTAPKSENSKSREWRKLREQKRSGY